MQVNQRTVTEAARRAQIIDAAIEVIADLGYGQASFARIVERAGLSSTRMISYHFQGKDELMWAVLLAAMGVVDERMDERLAGITDRVEMLRGYIESQVDLLRTHPEHMRAITEVARNARDENGAPQYAPLLRDLRVGRLERQLAQGQREGVFGEFDIAVMAQTISQAVDGAAARRETDPDVDLADYARELADLFTRATRPTDPARNPN
ncbi:TetR/AcrR family transcriptional regulator [Actinokineospora iranica]|uniref:DNA-binding transcriptional regulator, AcrR family n=1 Tax=Actinokineospora iranica TaxID=1271860 RepID=A0A1G6PND7_9PSEU|nr:TetR/AcrR family transcriptional regulator [Actinokineospora iranica]SDC80855.1 DNA-binding transcriptional regulator, AcrR family [Actinokineospora iranica]